MAAVSKTDFKIDLLIVKGINHLIQNNFATYLTCNYIYGMAIKKSKMTGRRIMVLTIDKYGK